MNGSKAIKAVFRTLIDSELKSEFSWTGKGANGRKNRAFRDLKEIISLIYHVVRKADSTYCLKTCESDLTYRLLRSGPKK